MTAAQGSTTASLKAPKAPQTPPDGEAAAALTNDSCLTLLPGRNVHTSSAGSTGLSKQSGGVSGGLPPGNTPRVPASRAAPVCRHLHTRWETPLGPVFAGERSQYHTSFLPGSRKLLVRRGELELLLAASTNTSSSPPGAPPGEPGPARGSSLFKGRSSCWVGALGFCGVESR